MRLLSVLAATVATCVISLASLTAQAHQPLASTAYAMTAATNDGDTKPEKMTLIGKITNPAGPLPGAVVILTATKQMAVTNADGEFEFEVPANAGALQATVTYAGYADETMTLNAAANESTVSLTNAHVIVVSRKQQLKRYLKTAHKQVKHDLRLARQ
ncbi:hypothetical protein GCM10028824_20450 [Hymenobacter segetis]|uniref:Carboxypeptidase regulatory-like domain-containing protein n=1 Tax=Hymenobacter segetis TaxID=2025509 RepID=A0ABU9LST9_9BACT